MVVLDYLSLGFGVSSRDAVVAVDRTKKAD